MPWKIEVVGSPAIVEVIYEGVVTPAELREAFDGAVAAGIQHHTRSFLADLSALTGGHSLVDLMDIVQGLESNDIDRHVREAILVPAVTPIGPYAEFYDTACRNRGFNSRLFADKDAALSWLRDAPTS